MARKNAIQMMSEMKEFAALSAAEQRYICRSLEVAARGIDAFDRWARNPAESASMSAQNKLYRTMLGLIRDSVPDDIGIDATAEIIGPLITISAFDLGEGKIEQFASYRFLYERLLGPSVRSWLPSAFLAAAALPYLHPDVRKALLASVTPADAAAVGWSNTDPVFIPEWVDEVELTVAQS